MVLKFFLLEFLKIIYSNFFFYIIIINFSILIILIKINKYITNYLLNFLY